MDVSEIVTLINEQGRAWEDFKSTHISRLDELEKKLNRPFASSGTSDAGRSALTGEQLGTLNDYARALVSGNVNLSSQLLDELQRKGMATAPDGAGGYLVHPEYSAEWTTIAQEIAPFATQARTVEMKQGDRFMEPVDRGQAATQWVGETDARNETDAPDIGQVEIPLHELQAQPQVSQKMLDTVAINLWDWLQGKVIEAFLAAEATAFFSGNGVSKPRGFLSYPTAATADATRAWGTVEHVVTGAGGAFAASNPSDVLIKLVNRQKAPYRAGSMWYMNRETASAVQQFKDGQGRYLWLDSLAVGQPPSLLGFPVQLAEEMPAIASNSLSVAFMNPKRAYTIARRLGVRYLVDPYTSKPHVKLYSTERVGGAVNNFEAIKLLKFSA